MRPLPSWLFSMHVAVGTQLGSELGLSQRPLGTSVCTGWSCTWSPAKHDPLGHGAPDGKEIGLLQSGWPWKRVW